MSSTSIAELTKGIYHFENDVEYSCQHETITGVSGSQYRNADGSTNFSPISWVDIVGPGDDKDDGRAHEKLRQFTSKVPSTKGTTTSGFRILFITYWHRRNDSSEGVSVPFESDIMKEIFQGFKLPDSFMSLFNNVSMQFMDFPTANNTLLSDGSSIGVIFDDWSVMWNQDGNFTNGVVFCLRGMTEELLIPKWKQLVTRFHPFAAHENFLGILTSTFASTYFNRWICLEKRTLIDMTGDIENYFGEDSEDSANPSKRNFARYSASVSIISRNMTHLHVGLSAMKALNIILAKRSIGVDKSITNYIEYLQMSTLNLLQLAAMVEKWASSTQSTLYTILSQREARLNVEIAEASRALALESKRDQAISIEIARASKLIAQHSKRDSASMKQIALVTMIFLPGTFVASHMAMPLFDWFQTNHQGVISGWYWLYWVFTIPITGIISIYCWRKLKQHDRLAAIDDKREMDEMNAAMADKKIGRVSPTKS